MIAPAIETSCIPSLPDHFNFRTQTDAFGSSIHQRREGANRSYAFSNKFSIFFHHCSYVRIDINVCRHVLFLKCCEEVISLFSSIFSFPAEFRRANSAVLLEKGTPFWTSYPGMYFCHNTCVGYTAFHRLSDNLPVFHNLAAYPVFFIEKQVLHPALIFVFPGVALV